MALLIASISVVLAALFASLSAREIPRAQQDALTNLGYTLGQRLASASDADLKSMDVCPLDNVNRAWSPDRLVELGYCSYGNEAEARKLALGAVMKGWNRVREKKRVRFA